MLSQQLEKTRRVREVFLNIPWRATQQTNAENLIRVFVTTFAAIFGAICIIALAPALISRLDLVLFEKQIEEIG